MVYVTCLPSTDSCVGVSSFVKVVLDAAGVHDVRESGLVNQ